MPRVRMRSEVHGVCLCVCVCLCRVHSFSTINEVHVRELWFTLKAIADSSDSCVATSLDITTVEP